MEAQAARAEATGQFELLGSRLLEQQNSVTSLQQLVADRDQTIASLTAQAALQTEQALRKSSSVKPGWPDAGRGPASPRIAAFGMVAEVRPLLLASSGLSSAALRCCAGS